MVRILKIFMRCCRLPVILPGLLTAPAAMSGCTTSNVIEPAEPQPRVAAYRCGPGGGLTIENFQTSVHVVSPRGLDVELPASPPGSRSRYGEAPYALLLEGRDALWMETGKEPVSCRR